MLYGQVVLGLLLHFGHAYQRCAARLIGLKQTAVRHLGQALGEGVIRGYGHGLAQVNIDGRQVKPFNGLVGQAPADSRQILYIFVVGAAQAGAAIG
ncbi:MAG TPA: hypothetical protein DHV63_15615, partial [Pseudomonas sp.]|nr:hypothetical protein [Pseudomonas sp.]